MVCDQNKITMIKPITKLSRSGKKCDKGKILVTDHTNRQNYDFGRKKLDFYMNYC